MGKRLGNTHEPYGEAVWAVGWVYFFYLLLGIISNCLCAT